MSANYINTPWENPAFSSPYIKWVTPGDEVEGRVTGYGQGEFPATADKPAQPYAVCYLDTAMGAKELPLSQVDLKEQWFSKKPGVGDLVKVRYLREAEKKKLFDVQVTRAAQPPVAQEAAQPPAETPIPF